MFFNFSLIKTTLPRQIAKMSTNNHNQSQFLDKSLHFFAGAYVYSASSNFYTSLQNGEYMKNWEDTEENSIQRACRIIP